eukprot:TRINITY_DN9936_c0_g1_i4.p1 TRINITY_DN9936_c0_g1~~TRINITY_DN9936_c0_g1_i4.p1  ORF type:complete len:115 (-),score=3.04 TRINITY_DN9936_c0_g1_i4:142-486(-)
MMMCTFSWPSSYLMRFSDIYLDLFDICLYVMSCVLPSFVLDFPITLLIFHLSSFFSGQLGQNTSMKSPFRLVCFSVDYTVIVRLCVFSSCWSRTELISTRSVKYINTFVSPSIL